MQKRILYSLLIIFSVNASHQEHETSRHTDKNISMRGMYGNYPMTRESSGTSWIPQSTPMDGIHKFHNNWNWMFHGYSYLIFDHQRGPRGAKKFFDENMWMIMVHKTTDCGTLGFRSMVTLEPITVGKRGYPLLFQTGETANGKTPLIDRQHPHDLFAELAVTYSKQFNDTDSYFLYFGLPGEPAVGPATFVHRFSAMYNPEAPLGHHWMDSTHITFGVLTAGIIHNNAKIEGSLFTGREPDQHRFDFKKA